METNSTAGSSGDGKPFITVNELHSSMHTVMSNDDLLIEILLRLPVISLVLFKTVSRRWLSLIKDTQFTIRRNHMGKNQIANLDYPSGLFLWFNLSFESNYIFVPLDMRIPVRRFNQHTGFTFLSQTRGDLHILQSCNGLFLCSFKGPREYYVYNPSINLFKILPENENCNPYRTPLLRMAFDPAKSPYYKVMYLELTYDVDGPYIQIQTYFSQTCNWSVSCDRYPMECYSDQFNSGLYWNDAIHWLSYFNKQYSHYKLDQISNERLVFRILQLPKTLDRNGHSDCKLFDSRSCLLLLYMDSFHSPLLLNIYEMRNGSSEWSMKYFVKLDEIMRPFPDTWSTSSIYCILSGEREEDTYMVMKLYNKVVQYKIVSKTICTLTDLGPVSYLIGRFEFIASLARV